MRFLVAVLLVSTAVSCDPSEIREPSVDLAGTWTFTFTGEWHSCQDPALNGNHPPLAGIVLEQDRFEVRGTGTLAGHAVNFSGSIRDGALTGTFSYVADGKCDVGAFAFWDTVNLVFLSSRLRGTHDSRGINCVTCVASGEVTGQRS